MFTPAKINIGLKIIGKRDDGYHNLETIFYPVKLYDEVEVSVERSSKNTNSLLLHSDSRIVPNDKSNVCYKTVVAFFRIFGIRDYYVIKINVNKKIPVGGGLGGGSSDAASVLKFLINYFKIDININRKKVIEIALLVGSDVPFFLVQKPCFASGRGENMKILKDFNLNAYKILLINPNLHISTKWAFEALGLEPGEARKSELSSVTRFDLSNLEVLVNDFESVVFEKYDFLGRIKEELRDFGAVFSSLSGSGATMYGIFHRSSADDIKKALNFYKSKAFLTHISD